LIFGSPYNFGGVVSAKFVKWSKGFLGIERKFGGVKEILEVQEERPFRKNSFLYPKQRPKAFCFFQLSKVGRFSKYCRTGKSYLKYNLIKINIRFKYHLFSFYYFVKNIYL